MTERPRTRSVTRAVRAGIGTDAHHGAVVPPIHLSTTFTFEGFGRKRLYDYTRTANPTRDELARALADLEGGAGAVVTSTGMSAVTLVLQILRPGERVVAPHDCYGGTRRAIAHLARRGHFEVEFVDMTQPNQLEAALARGAQLVWIETPSNPLLRITDIARVVLAARQAGALVAADNTFLSPVLQRPLQLGADFVVHSTTKYLNGHSDVVGGAVVARDPALLEQLAWVANCLGLTSSPFDSFLTLRGLRTLHARMRAHEENAGRVVEALSAHLAVARVYYPGLPDHPGRLIALAQQTGFGAMVSFELASVEAIPSFLEGIRLFSLAESLGGVESLIAHPATMTHASMEPEERAVAGISDRLLRLSVGIEHADDLVEDLRNGLEAAARVSADSAEPDTGSVEDYPSLRDASAPTIAMLDSAGYRGT
jgi:cystathionine gamma-synthase